MEITWTKGVEMPETLEGFSAVAVPNRGIFIFGGVDNDGIDQNSLFQYSPTNKSWRKMKSSISGPTGRSNCGLSFSLNEEKLKLYVFGGLNCQVGWTNTIWRGDIDQDTVNWVEVKHNGEIFTSRDKMTVVPDVENSTCYLIGGFGPIDAAESEGEDEDEPEDIRDQRQHQKALDMGWFDEVITFNFIMETFDVLVTKGVEGCAGKAAASGFLNSKNEIYLFGGRSSKGRTNEIVSLNLESQTWEVEKPGGFIPAPRSFISYCNYKDSLFIFGGQGISDELLGGLHRFSNGSWSKIESSSNLITPRRQSGFVSFEDSIYLMGGSDKLDMTTGINNILTEMWIGNIGERKSGIGASMADLGLKRK